MDWTVEHDLVLLENLGRFPPCGPHGPFNLLVLQHRLQTALSMEVPVGSIVDRINVLYDVDAWARRAEEAGSAALPDVARREFQVPEQLPPVFAMAEAALARSRSRRDAAAATAYHSASSDALEVTASPAAPPPRPEFVTPEESKVTARVNGGDAASDLASMTKARSRGFVRRALDLSTDTPPAPA